jgi:hypothetical protein
VRLDNPLLAVGVHEHDRSIFARVFREDRAETWKVGAHERGSIRISSRTFGNPVLDRGIEPL